MSFRPLKSFFPTAEILLQQDLPTLVGALLTHLKSYEGLNTVYQHGRLNRGYFRAMLESKAVGLGTPPPPEYGVQQPEVTKRMMEAWNWLERQSLLMHTELQVADWFVISREGEELLKRNDLYERWERQGVDRVKSDLMYNAGRRTGNVGGGSQEKDWAWEWVVRMKENKPPLKPAGAGEWVLIAESRLEEIRALKSSEFDFRKLIRMCEELNIAYREESYFATAMLTRGLLDHVPPIFGRKNFDEVASNYGGKSFKGTMQHLQNASRNVADAYCPASELRATA